jgi:hypothetical protein
MAATFNKDAMQRIAKAVRRVESMGNDRGSSRLPSGPDEQSFWAFIVGIDFADDGTNLYSFLRVRPEHKDPDIRVEMRQGFSLVDPVIVYHSAAVEVNGTPTPSNVAVRMQFTGYRDFTGGERRAMFAFNFSPFYVQPYLPIHDHRDNNNGGFAFAIYHPGTGLPQMPWHL